MRKCEHSIIDEYLKLVGELEAPKQFHRWTMLVLMASILQRQVKLNRVHFDLYPNLYVILVAGTARCHKSHSIKEARNILKKTGLDIKVFAQKITNERLIQFLGGETDVDEPKNRVTIKSHGLIMSSELSTFLGQRSMEKGIITTLTDLYDCPDEWTYETKNSGKDSLHNIYLNMIGASTRKWLRQAIPEEAVGGGFISRTVFVNANEPNKLVPFPEDVVPANRLELTENVVHDLVEMSKLEGEFEWGTGAKDWYRSWYEDNASAVSAMGDEETFFTRWDSILIKIAMLVSVAKRDDLMILVEDLEEAEVMLDEVKYNMKDVIDDLTHLQKTEAIKYLEGIISRRKIVSHKQLLTLARRRVTSTELEDALKMLKEAGIIRESADTGGRSYQYLEE